MSSHYAAYIKAREGFDIIEDEFGFASYKITDGDCYIRDVFVVPESRMDRHASRFVDQIRALAKEKGSKSLVTTVCPSAVGSTDSLKVILAYGFKLAASQNDFIIFRIDL